MNSGDRFIEHLQFRVDPAQADAFREHNRRWLAALRRQPGFLAQRAYRHAEQSDVWLVLVVWQDEAAMQAFPDELQRKLDGGEQVTWTLLAAEHYREVDG